MSTPEHKALMWEDGFKEIHDEVTGTWRHGTENFTVWQDEETGQLWAASYRISTDGETNELREGQCKIFEVEAFEKTTIHYRTKK